MGQYQLTWAVHTIYIDTDTDRQTPPKDEQFVESMRTGAGSQTGKVENMLLKKDLPGVILKVQERRDPGRSAGHMWWFE